MSNQQIILAGGGHSHALVLRKWAMNTRLRPEGTITLIDRNSITLYSGMLPGLIAGHYKKNDLSIDLRAWSARAGVAFIMAEIVGVDLRRNLILLDGRPPIYFSILSLDIGSETKYLNQYSKSEELKKSTSIKPFLISLDFIQNEDEKSLSIKSSAFRVIGSGLAAIEVVFALRRRWPLRRLEIQADISKIAPPLRQGLANSKVKIIPRKESIVNSALLCTGNETPHWIKETDLKLSTCGRVITYKTLQSIEYPYVFAVGDCAIVKDNFRPASGVWAVRSANILGANLARFSKHSKLLHWTPQKNALQLIGGLSRKKSHSVAWAIWGKWIFGPSHFIWKIKQSIDQRFMKKFHIAPLNMNTSELINTHMACRGCAAKLPSEPLQNALRIAGLDNLASYPQDASLVPSSGSSERFFQSIDGFPSLVSDPWLNGRLTAFHACSDLWATGIYVSSAQALITLPAIHESVQQELLIQSLSGINSALAAQGAKLIGGHTLEARSDSPQPSSLGLQIGLTVNGALSLNSQPWMKSGLQSGDDLMISRGLGSGVIFAAAMLGQASPEDLDSMLNQLNSSQHTLLANLVGKKDESTGLPLVHACTDITGFGLLGHLEEMLLASNYQRLALGLAPLSIRLDARFIPSFNGALSLFKRGFSSTLAPSNRRAWRLLSHQNKLANIHLELNGIVKDSEKYQGIMELIVDPQTCGPLVLGCCRITAKKLASEGIWKKIGSVV